MHHPRLCRMAHVWISLLLYADDAALPADTAQDLQISADIFEAFCNDYRLFIAVPKTFLTVFHDATDTNVLYTDGKVFVDGQRVDVKIYGQSVTATDNFKYLGISLDEFGSPDGHIRARASAFKRAAGSFFAGL
eukprot:10644363-Karenia_brevis.AAC.1